MKNGSTIRESVFPVNWYFRGFAHKIGACSTATEIDNFHVGSMAVWLPTTTSDNVQGLIPEWCRESGFVGVREPDSFSTLFGTLALY